LNATIDERLQYTTRDERVRIAILDTGLDHHHEDFKQARTKEFIGKMGDVASPVEGECPQSHRIRKRRNFCVNKEEDENEGTDDLDGHGTQVAGIILRLAPNADLYIARVCGGDLTYGHPEVQTQDKGNKDFCKPQPSVVAKVGLCRRPTFVPYELTKPCLKAIRWAVEEEVHIINLSLGFRRCDYADLKDLRDALKEAQGHKIVVFAATSNEGIHDQVAWPAKDPEYAIGIHSSIDFGVRKSDFTANPFQPGANFMAVGENILSQWPNAKGAGFRLCTGSSFATPVATAIGALVLAFIWQTICRVERAKVADIVPLDDIRTNHGMTKLLRAISTPQDGGYLAIHPKLFWNNYHDVKDGKLNTTKSRGHAWDIIEKALRM
jgi:subtilisin family serine protease